MEKLNLHEVVEAVGGRLLQPSAENTEILSVVTDSRKITPGCVFIALSGERFDAHAFVDAALDQGAAGCIISREPAQGLRPDKFYILVGDTRKALGDLARFYRLKFKVKVVGITGSVGKTTCREMVTSVLSKHFRVHATEGNFNNDIGLPLTIFGLSAQDEVMVLEMGMNHPGEIRRLSQIAAPDIAVITNIGTAHIGNLGSRDNIFLAKKEIFEGMEEGGTAVLCGDDDYLPRIAQMPELASKFRIFYAGMDGKCDFRAQDVRVEAEGLDTESAAAELSTVCRILMPEELVSPGQRDGSSSSGRGEAAAGHGLEVRIHAAGAHLAWPASLAAGVGRVLGMTGPEIREGLEAFTGQRMPCEKYGDILLFDDTYNASPDSMKSSLQVLAALPVRHRAAVLGDMLEQGEFASALHREVGEAAARSGIDTLITVGPLSEEMAAAAGDAGLIDVRSFPDRDSAASAVEEITVPGTALLFKASHSMALDRLAAVSRKKAEKLARK